MNPELSADQQDCLKKLTIPFHPDAISWRVTNKVKDGKRAASFFMAISALTPIVSTTSPLQPAGPVFITSRRCLQ